RTERDRRSQSATFVSTRSDDVQVSLQYRSSTTLPEMSRSARQASPSDGRGPWLVCRCVSGSATDGGESSPRIRPRSRAMGWRKCRYATIVRYQMERPGRQLTSDRSAYATFLET